MWAPGGKLAQRGLIAAPEPLRAQALKIVTDRLPLDPRGLH
jgi:phosphate transport system substrate-binding protein